MRTHWGPLTRLLIANIAVMAVVSGVISTFAVISIRLVDHSMQQVHDVSDSAALSARIRAQCLDLTDLVRRYALGSPNTSDLIMMISVQQRTLFDLIDQAQSTIESGNLEQAQQVAVIRQSLTAFTNQAARVMSAFDLNKSSSPGTLQELNTLILNYQDPLISALQEYENAQDARANLSRGQAEDLISWMALIFLLINLLVIGGGFRMVRQMVVRVAHPLGELRIGVENFRQGRLDHTIAIKSKDEVGLLAEAFNTLASEVRESRAQLEAYAHSLESQVAERTREAEQRADQAAQLSVLAHARADELERLASQAQTAAEISSFASSTLDLERLLQQSVNLIQDRFNLTYAGLFLVDEPRHFAELRAMTGPGMAALLGEHHKLPIDEASMIGWCILHAQYRIAQDVTQDPIRARHPLLPDSGSEFAIPLVSRGQVIGALTVQIDRINAFQSAEVATFQTMAAQLANMIANAQLYHEVQQLAIIDSLTGVFNRRYLFELAVREFDRAVRYHQSLALILFDIDHFKQINDEYGHPTGDQVLTSLGQACRDHLRAIDLIGRYGGEEFLVVMPETDEIEAIRVAERLRREVEKIRIPVNDHQVKITISLGVTASTPDLDDHLDSLVKRADDALYTAKRAGRNRVEITAE